MKPADTLAHKHAYSHTYAYTFMHKLILSHTYLNTLSTMHTYTYAHTSTFRHTPLYTHSHISHTFIRKHIWKILTHSYILTHILIHTVSQLTVVYHAAGWLLLSLGRP